jgi:hypothetical protein
MMKFSIFDSRFWIAGAPGPEAIPHLPENPPAISNTPAARQRPNRKSRIENRK